MNDWDTNYKKIDKGLHIGDGKLITDTLLSNMVNNEDSNYANIQALIDKTDPEVLYSQKREYMDNDKSIGVCSCEDVEYSEYDAYQLDDTTSENYNIGFGNDDDSYRLITEDSNVSIINDNSNSKDEDSYCTLPLTTGTVKVSAGTKVSKKIKETNKDLLCAYDKGAYNNFISANGHWYVGFNINKNYNVTNKQKKNPHLKMNSVARAIVFKANRNGVIRKVVLGLMTDKSISGNIYAEIRPIIDGKISETVLSRTSLKFRNHTNHLRTFSFKKHAKVTKGKKYAIVIKAPLCKHYQSYNLIGWQRSCYKKTTQTGKINVSSVWTSIDNGYTWINGAGKGVVQPAGFSCEIYIAPTTVVTSSSEAQKTKNYTYYNSNGEYNLIMKLDNNNPVVSVTVDPNVDVPVGTNIQWFISSNAGRDWEPLMKRDAGNDLYYNFGESTPSRFVYIKAVLSTIREDVAPKLYSLSINTVNVPSLEGVLRTLPFVPEHDTMLSPCIWARAGVDFEIKNKTHDYTEYISVDVVRESVVKDYFTIMDLHNTNFNPNDYENNTVFVTAMDDIISKLEEKYKTQYTSKDYKDMSIIYLFNKSEYNDYKSRVLNSLKQSNAYIFNNSFKDVELETGEHIGELKIEDSFILTNNPAYPCISATISESHLTYEDGSSTDWSLIGDNEALLKLPSEWKIGSENRLQSITLVESTEIDITEDSSEILPADEHELILVEKTNFSNSDYTDLNGDTHQADVRITNNPNELVFNLNTGYVKKDSSGKIVFEHEGKTYDLIINFTGVDYIEELDYTVEGKELMFKENHKPIIEGEFCVSYNPLGLSLDSIHCYNESCDDAELSAKLDLREQNIFNTVKDEEYSLDCEAVNPLRQVKLYNNAGEFISDLEEDIDFSVDYIHNTILFKKEDLPVDAHVQLKYTPALFDNSLSLQINMKRSNNDENVYTGEMGFVTRT